MESILKALLLGSLLLSLGAAHDPWGENHRAKINTDFVSSNQDSIFRFLGNQTHKDYFKILRQDGNSLLIGARNVIYNVSLPDLVENVEQRITWSPTKKDVDICLVKGRSEDDCQNYIRVLARTSEDELLVCGTNAFKPKYRTYTKKKGSSVYEGGEERPGTGICPYDPRHNSTSIYSDGEIFSGTVADFSGTDSIIFRNGTRTVQYNLKQLNNPDFVGSMEDEDYIYFFFRESAVEYINCGKTIYSRVARICKNDKGGPHYQDRWTTFIKARLNCSVPGNDQPFFFNEIQSVTSFDSSLPMEERIIYGVFTTPDNAISGSAICAFKMSSIIDAFNGEFRDQDESNSLWLPIPKALTPSNPRPGTCHNDSRSLPSSTLNFAKLHNLMAQNVNPQGEKPLFIKTSIGERLTVIASDPRHRDLLHPESKFDVLFVGTTGGRVLKIVNSVLIESLQIFPYHVPVRNLMVVEDHLLALSDHEVASLPVQRCADASAQSCGDCVALQDPYCAWNVHTSQCVSHEGQDISQLLQSVDNGYHSGCPESSYSEPYYDDEIKTHRRSLSQDTQNYGPRFHPSTAYKNRSDKPIYTEKTLALATISAAFTALLLGFLGGYFLSKRCEKPLKLEFLDRRAGNLKSNGSRRGCNVPGGELGLDSGYATPSNLNSASTGGSNGSSNNNKSKSINLLVNVPPKSETVKAAPIQGPQNNNINNNNNHNLNVNSSTPGTPLNAPPGTPGTGTLQKVKRIYI